MCFVLVGPTVSGQGGRNKVLKEESVNRIQKAGALNVQCSQWEMTKGHAAGNNEGQRLPLGTHRNPGEELLFCRDGCTQPLEEVQWGHSDLLPSQSLSSWLQLATMGCEQRRHLQLTPLK